MAKRKLVYGVGISDSKTPVHIAALVDGKRVNIWTCPFYRSWAHMLARCYSESAYPTYKGCTVCDEWLTFSSFKAWMETQDWEGKHLDKDILVPGNKVYSPEVCVFVAPVLNSFVNNNASARGAYAIGVSWDRARSRFKAHCKNPFTLRQENLGRFSTPEEAHEAWRRRKHELACQYADMQTDPRVAEALRTRFAAATPFTSTEPKEVCNA